MKYSNLNIYTLYIHKVRTFNWFTCWLKILTLVTSKHRNFKKYFTKHFMKFHNSTFDAEARSGFNDCCDNGHIQLYRHDTRSRRAVCIWPMKRNMWNLALSVHNHSQTHWDMCVCVCVCVCAWCRSRGWRRFGWRVSSLRAPTSNASERTSNVRRRWRLDCSGCPALPTPPSMRTFSSCNISIFSPALRRPRSVHHRDTGTPPERHSDLYNSGGFKGGGAVMAPLPVSKFLSKSHFRV